MPVLSRPQVETSSRSAIGKADTVVPFIGRAEGRSGGFGVGSDFAWQTLAAFGYRFALLGADATAQVGYPALSQAYADGAFRLDMTGHRPGLGLTLRF